MSKFTDSIMLLIGSAGPAVAGSNPYAAVGIFAIEEAIKIEPAIADEFKTLFSGPTPTAADFAALRAKVAGESYQAFVPDSRLNTPAAPTPAAAPVPALVGSAPTVTDQAAAAELLKATADEPVNGVHMTDHAGPVIAAT